MTNPNDLKSGLSKHLTVAGATALLLWASSDSALAYLDPGTGSIILQALIAGVIGSAAVAKMYWRHLKSMLRRTFGADRHQDHSQDQ